MMKVVKYRSLIIFQQLMFLHLSNSNGWLPFTGAALPHNGKYDFLYSPTSTSFSASNFQKTLQRLAPEISTFIHNILFMIGTAKNIVIMIETTNEVGTLLHGMPTFYTPSWYLRRIIRHPIGTPQLQ